MPGERKATLCMIDNCHVVCIKHELICIERQFWTGKKKRAWENSLKDDEKGIFNYGSIVGQWRKECHFSQLVKEKIQPTAATSGEWAVVY